MYLRQFQVGMKFLSIALLIIHLLFCVTNAKPLSAENTIYNTSIKWEDEIHKKKLLETVPGWDTSIINYLFDIYLHPEKFNLPTSSSLNSYNMRFIHVFWGPLNNPFVKYTRPAKVFVFFNGIPKDDLFYSAPIIKNRDDKNYYVFDKRQSYPFIFNDWIQFLLKTNPGLKLAGFNICNGYGTSPSDTCKGSYQNEAKNSIQFSNILSKMADYETSLSAARAPYEDWTIKASHNVQQDSIQGSSIPWDDEGARKALLNTVNAWPNLTIIKDLFKKIRDMRYFNDSAKENFLRRISWLYPDDGCFSRMAAVVNDYFGPISNELHYFSRPSKIFAFGNLCVNTNNSPHGFVTWWYHVAPIIKNAEDNQTYVLDPSINPYEPLLVEKWITQISATTGPCSRKHAMVNVFNICNGYGSGPADICQDFTTTNFLTETAIMLYQNSYQKAERRRQDSLGRDADKVLGDEPPWL